MSPIYKIVNQDDTPLYQISKPNPNADFWTMFYFKYAGHQIPPRRVEVSQRRVKVRSMLMLVWQDCKEPSGEGRWNKDHHNRKDRR